MENQPEAGQSTVGNSQITNHQSQVTKTNSFLVILLSILLFISVAIAGFFAYQTQKLAKELTAYSVQVTQTPTLITSIEPTVDPTAGWKTYTNEKYNFSIHYPNNWMITENPTNDIRAAQNSIRLSNSIASIYISIYSEYGGACPPEYQKITIDNQIHDVCVSENATEGEKAWEQITFQKDKNIIELRGYAKKSTPEELLVPQILSTFKFND